MTSQSSPLPAPRRSQDPNWAKKIEIAKQAREAGKSFRGSRTSKAAGSPAPETLSFLRK